MVCRAWTIYYLAPYRKSLPSPGLEMQKDRKAGRPSRTYWREQGMCNVQVLAGPGRPAMAFLVDGSIKGKGVQNLDKDLTSARTFQKWGKASCEQLFWAIDGISKRQGIGSDPEPILKWMLLLFTQLINAWFTRWRSPAMGHARVQGREAGFQMGKAFLSFTHSFPQTFIKHPQCIKHQTNHWRGKGVGARPLRRAEHMETWERYREGRKGNEKERHTSRGKGKKKQRGKKDKRECQEMRKIHGSYKLHSK